MANPFRNECAVILNGSPYILRATFGALVEIEELVGKPIPKIMEDISEANMSLTNLKAILVAGIKGAEGSYDENKLEEDIAEAGLVALSAGVCDFLVVGSLGGEKIKKN